MPVAEHDVQRTAEDCPWLKDGWSTKVCLQPKIYRTMPPAEAKAKWAKTAQQIKALMKKHGCADMPLSIDYSTPYLVHALENEGLEVVDGNGFIDEAGMVKFDDEILCMKMAAAIAQASLRRRCNQGFSRGHARE